MRWYYVINGDVVGPVRTHYLSRIYDKGIVNDRTYIFNSEVVADWTKMKHVAGLLDELVGKSKTGIYHSKSKKKKKKKKKKRSRKKKSRIKKPVKKRQQITSMDNLSEKEFNLHVPETTNNFLDNTVLNSELTNYQTIVTLGDWVKLINGSIGRILYVGQVQGMIGEILGIELNEPYGNGDGEIGGKRYFQCKSGHGVFATRTHVQYVISGPDKFNLENKSNLSTNTVRKEDKIVEVLEELNLYESFDFVSFTMAVNAMDLNYSFKEMENSFQCYEDTNLKQPCTNARDQLTFLLHLLQHPIEEPISEIMNSDIEQDESEEIDSDDKIQAESRWKNYSITHPKMNNPALMMKKPSSNSIEAQRKSLTDLKLNTESQLSLLSTITPLIEDKISNFQKASIIEKSSAHLLSLQETLDELDDDQNPRYLDLFDKTNGLVDINESLKAQNETLLEHLKLDNKLNYLQN